MCIQVLQMTEGGDEAFYRNFLALGYNKQLERDECDTFNVLVSAPKNGLVTGVRVMRFI